MATSLKYFTITGSGGPQLEHDSAKSMEIKKKNRATETRRTRSYKHHRREQQTSQMDNNTGVVLGRVQTLTRTFRII